MLSRRLIKEFDKGRLRSLLTVFFVMLAMPTGVLIWQAYSQLKWEAFHQHRGVAEELTRRIDMRLNEMIRTADARSFADYAFLVVSGEPSANFVQRSPLSAYPVTEDLPGVIGYFQVDSDGTFSTPLLPPEGTGAASLGIGENEYAGRLRLAQEIRSVLVDNRLVQSRSEVGAGEGKLESIAVQNAEIGTEAAANEDTYRASGFRQETTEPESAGSADMVGISRGLRSAANGDPETTMTTEADAVYRDDAKPTEQIDYASRDYSQQVFDRLNQPKSGARSYADNPAAPEFDEAPAAASSKERPDSIGKVSELKLDAALQKKSEEVERDGAREQPGDSETAHTQSRAKRREQIALPEAVPATDDESMTTVAGPGDLRISTFESEIDPFDFSLLDSGHFVLFRNVWREGERYIQGLLVDQAAFVQYAIAGSFMNTSLSNMSNLIVAYQDNVLRTFSGREGIRYPNVAEDLDGALLYRARLTAPLDALELIFSITRLPPGPGAGILGWVTLVLAIVFVGGFLVLYRLGLSQINLARQQQDFVSAVSHELKSPLTSIRMYGEMLKEGWADEDKRQRYYEFIHDESERLSRLISNILQLAKITRNEPQYNLQPTNVGRLMTDTEIRIAEQVKHAGYELRFNRSDVADRVTISIDDDCFIQIIINLVDNAIKFSKQAQHKAIEISSKLVADNRIMFSVRDFGPGVPKDQMQKIFELFYRSESELTRETVGTGIGLAIVHQLTLAMNGDVDIVNVEPGAEFQIRFPVVDGQSA